MSSERSRLRRRTPALALIPPLAVCIALVLGICAGSPALSRAQEVEATDGRRFYPDDPLLVDPDTRDVPPVQPREVAPEFDFIANTFYDLGKGFGPARDVNTIDQVPDSSWFTNRIGRRPMSVAEVARGPNTTGGPAPGRWTVTGRPAGGVTPKFTIEDARGDTYLIKLDPPDHPQLASSAELITTKILHAIGYWVPENYVVDFHPDRLRIQRETDGSEDSDSVVHAGDLEEWLDDQPRDADGRIRALASRFIPGEPVGPFNYWGTRPDDPNDVIRHEHRRSLRGLRVFAAWLHHDDTKALNSLDTYVEEDGRRFLRHYLIDFGATLGSASTHVKRLADGREYYVEGQAMWRGVLGLGLATPDWATVDYPEYPSVGRYEATHFDPGAWKPNYPNPAFKRMDAADAFWAASIVSSFTDEMIRAVVAEARMSDAEAAAYLADMMILRRDAVVRHWITATNPLDRFEIVRPAAGGLELTFDNAARRVGATTGPDIYVVRWSRFDNRTGNTTHAGDAVSTRERRIRVPRDAWGPLDDDGCRFTVAEIWTEHADFPNWRAPVRVTLRDRDGRLHVVGIERTGGAPDPSGARPVTATESGD